MSRRYTWENLKNKVRGIIVRNLIGSRWLPFIYRGYWHKLLCPCKRKEGVVQFYSARPNPGAGIGHQMGNWHAGLWHAAQFGLSHAHMPFSTDNWERFLGYGNGEVTVDELKHQGYKVRHLPFFMEDDERMIAVNKEIIASYSGEKVVFVAEQDQRYDLQYGVREEIQKRFYSSPARKEDKLIYQSGHFNIAVHVRRGDIMADLSKPELAMRYLANDYYYKVLSAVIRLLKVNKPVNIYLFSQGKPEDFPEFKEFENLHWCLDMNARQSFLHMVYADLLITSKSSFSYKPALLNKKIKVSPRNFWHGYPDEPDWILCNDDGTFCNTITMIKGQ